eukprot:TRINITY_DN985_c0_g1_i1.p1 TRINITY_DN985_c0_g1~~TRINITY_DN985_c0_g1_i1.p1  ORF type:complete len:499 (+),score=147.83 TRINITY_DN985_c0_g1_i1:113-1498(+)
MYQCQMGKQTMGTPMHSFPYRPDNKLYRIQNPQAPLVRTLTQEAYDMNCYPTGANAIVAVISYTGYDMEDAMILNKQSFERGFGHAFVYATKVIELREARQSMRGPKKVTKRFGNVKSMSKRFVGDNSPVEPGLDHDGLPAVGLQLTAGTPFYCTYDEITDEFHVEKYKSNEDAVVEEIRITEYEYDAAQTVSIKLRYDRRPVIGDKFSSRHGQKGVLSRLWPLEDLPFTESGMCPDLIINPNAFPSRMTIGMLIESMAGKAGSLHGVWEDSTPFRFDENNRAVDYFGEQLLKAGYNYYGNEPLYSGTLGAEFYADIFIGVVYYQRLRHMVKDKFQVRSTGPVQALTQQPVKGRKKGGGIRLGEMERDSLLAHGAAFVLHDRLFHCSDEDRAYVCRKCGSILSTHSFVSGVQSSLSKFRITCSHCDTSSPEDIRHISIPYVFRYLANELLAMNIKIMLDVK